VPGPFTGAEEIVGRISVDVGLASIVLSELASGSCSAADQWLAIRWAGGMVHGGLLPTAGSGAVQYAVWSCLPARGGPPEAAARRPALR
jgi:hypothetical protein